ncbi:MAG: pilus assembly protein PilZ [Gammaproteobacteria bacterium CG_4_10_14_0_8_um_filter_38_16]|nr:MAG: pilus assembly protein PilZ [Gammaproteobacteria bacterium CG_4_10_14_0_8_um_filter_38_16]PJA03173.1 MAG: pilus assembly protein PilZ [Gammaproteobacteria bacterium CG_4_10_14_0_2_um_filter_38_22]PJB09965.1 MAG: pilus assembly protein PilZ [Gammaproteobacteria bacterium CG_4_9_14_3_um_filter_38_9]
MSDKIQLTHQYATLTDLKNAFMPFVQDGGIFIPTDVIFHLGDLAAVSLTLPETGHTFSFAGEIIWITPKTGQHSAGVGVQCNSNEGDTFQKEVRELISMLKDNNDTSNSETM